MFIQSLFGIATPAIRYLRSVVAILDRQYDVKALGKDAKGNIRIGIEAPKSVPVQREVIYNRIK